MHALDIHTRLMTLWILFRLNFSSTCCQSSDCSVSLMTASFMRERDGGVTCHKGVSHRTDNFIKKVMKNFSVRGKIRCSVASLVLSYLLFWLYQKYIKAIQLSPVKIRQIFPHHHYSAKTHECMNCLTLKMTHIHTEIENNRRICLSWYTDALLLKQIRII